MPERVTLDGNRIVTLVHRGVKSSTIRDEYGYLQEKVSNRRIKHLPDNDPQRTFKDGSTQAKSETHF